MKNLLTHQNSIPLLDKGEERELEWHNSIGVFHHYPLHQEFGKQI